MEPQAAKKTATNVSFERERGVSGLTESNTLGNQNLKPEITTEAEIGLDMKMFNSRLGLDVALYNRDTKNQIINAAISPETCLLKLLHQDVT